MTVKSIESKGNYLKIGMTLANYGSQPINFGQGTMTVANDRTQSVNSTTTGLPNSLTANGKPVTISVSIPKNALDKAKSISLQLTDIDKKLQLEASGIPVGKK